LLLLSEFKGLLFDFFSLSKSFLVSSFFILADVKLLSIEVFLSFLLLFSKALFEGFELGVDLVSLGDLLGDFVIDLLTLISHGMFGTFDFMLSSDELFFLLLKESEALLGLLLLLRQALSVYWLLFWFDWGGLGLSLLLDLLVLIKERKKTVDVLSSLSISSLVNVNE